MGDFRCAHCGGPCGPQGHAEGLPVTFTCREGLENEALRLAGKPLRWDFGENVEAKNWCHVCRTPMVLMCPNSHIAIRVSEDQK